LVGCLTQDWKKLQNKVRFILAVIAEELIVKNRKKKEITQDLLKEGYDQFPEERKKKKAKKEEKDEDEEEEGEDDEKPKKKVEKDDLLSMKLWSFTVEQVEYLKVK